MLDDFENFHVTRKTLSTNHERSVLNPKGTTLTSPYEIRDLKPFYSNNKYRYNILPTMNHVKSITRLMSDDQKFTLGQDYSFSNIK